MVMPCSRSASRPSVSKDRSMSSCPRLLEARATAASWSPGMALVSCRSRPISVLLPSSTLPAVMKRSTPRSSVCCALRSISPSKVIRGLSLAWGIYKGHSHLVPPGSEISLLLAPLHGGFGGLVVHARRAALGHGGARRLDGDFGRRRGRRFDRAGAADVAHRAEPHGEFFHGLVLARRSDVGHRHQQSVPANDLPAVGGVERGYGEPLAPDVLPHVELGPVADRKHPHVLALVDPRVVEVPRFRALVLGVPLAEVVAEGEDALFRARLFLVAARSADRGVE